MKKENKMKKQNRCGKRRICRNMKAGFSLVETLVAVFVFSLAMTMLIGSFSGFLKTYGTSKKAQRSAESAQYTMNLIAKTIRSSVVDPVFASGGSQIKLFDKSRYSCVIFAYDAVEGVLKTATAYDGKVLITDISKCNLTDAPQLSVFTALTTPGEIFGVMFAGQPSSADGSILGKISVSMNVQNSASSQMQTSISLRQ